MKKFLIIACALLLSAGMAEAQPHRQINRKHQKAIVVTQKQQQYRIHQGIRSGAITPREAAKLRQQQASVRRHKRMAFADGHINRREFKRIKQQQQLTSHQIYIKKHNGNRR